MFARWCEDSERHTADDLPALAGSRTRKRELSQSPHDIEFGMMSVLSSRLWHLVGVEGRDRILGSKVMCAYV